MYTIMYIHVHVSMNNLLPIFKNMFNIFNYAAVVLKLQLLTSKIMLFIYFSDFTGEYCETFIGTTVMMSTGKHENNQNCFKVCPMI